MKTYWGVDVQLYGFLDSTLDGSGQLHTPATLPPEKGSPVPS